MSVMTSKELDALEAALVALYKATWRHKSWENIQRDAGVTLDRSSASLLKVVKNCGRSNCRIQDIAHYLNIEAPSVSRTVQDLEREGLVERHADSSDRRASNVVLTALGEQQLSKLQSAKRARFKVALQDWPETDRTELTRLIDKLAASFETLIHL
jgi:DNA-binding MarR family transcriptional regulator